MLGAAFVSAMLVSAALGWLARGWLSPSPALPPQSVAATAEATPAEDDAGVSSSPAIASPGSSPSEDLSGFDDLEPTFEVAPPLATATTPPPAKPPAITPIETPPTAPAVRPSAPLDQTQPTPQTAPNQAEHKLYQVLEVQRNPRFQVQGLPIAQEMHYRVVSELSLSGVQRGGERIVRQTVVAVKLDKCDASSMAVFKAQLENLVGDTFNFRLNADRQVVEFRGEAGPERKVAAGGMGALGMVSSVMDEDGWKELAELSFFTPERQSPGDTWVRQTTHDWGSLGAWSGDTTYALAAKNNVQTAAPLQAFSFERQLKYVPPMGEAAGPLAITAAEFNPPKVSGEIIFHPDREQVMSATEQFYVAGRVQANLLGQATTVQLEERQTMKLTLQADNPATQW